jgi:type III restriction enzyme
MELKNYQKAVMGDLSSFMDAVDQENDIVKGWYSYWSGKDICVGSGGVPFYQNKIAGVPHVCMKVPTGGGKTFMACSAIKKIYDRLPANKPKVVVWLVPSDSILTQTVRTLSDVSHPYRQRLDMDFAGRVGVYTKDMLLDGQNFSPDTICEMLTICVMSYASLRIDSKKKDVRKVYQENGNLFRFAEYFDDKSILLADTPDTALIQVLRYLSPVAVVDESHNAGSTLSVEMLNNLNPSFIMELTATPRSSSNIISYVDARELKKENMVKLPVVVFNRSSRQTVIQDAIQLRGNIEKQALVEASAGGKYIRPIVLFQAQPKISEDSDTFDKIKSLLIEMGIPQEQIAVKTSKVDDIGNTDLMSPNCEIRYIITVNALKEGWDCPFAYILASLANKTSKADVEQILGRILRQPYTRQHTAPLLNTSYVLTCSNDFRATLDSIVVGLNKSGFSRKDYRVAEELPTQEEPKQPAPEPQQMSFSAEDMQTEDTDDSFSDVNPQEVQQVIFAGSDGETDDTSEVSREVAAMIESATAQSEKYNAEINNTPDDGFVGGELGDMLTQNTIQKQYQEEAQTLRIPQFYIESSPDLFGSAYELLEPENLSEGFSLSGQDAQVSFELATGEMYRVDIQAEGEAVPKYKRASKSESEYIQKYLESLPQEGRIRQCASMIAGQINKNNRYATAEVEEYVRRIVANMTDDELSTMETAIPAYAAKIQKKIDSLEEIYRSRLFKKWLDSGKIVCKDSYALEPVITPASTIDSIPYSLYEAEKDDMNNFERQVIDVVVGTDNIRWWHRIIDRKGFRLNGYFNHYPDFMVMTKSGKIVLIEAKGDYLDGDDSKAKLELGRKWQEQAGRLYRYFMVFKDKELGMDGAYTLDKFVDVIKEI